MEELTRKYFEAIVKDREENAKLLSKASMRGVWNSVVEKYSELAHFILELLQNADDAGATKARFILSDTQLIFAHNGTRHFSVSDPATEEADTKAGRLGDVNAITSIANSNKLEASIGKFGVGFKAVFQYTDTPHIYGPGICFKIENFIVPRILEKDHPERREDETLFVFPFNKARMPQKVAVKDISMRLTTLDLPTLFLNNLEEIQYNSSASSCTYSKRIISQYTMGDIDGSLLEFVNIVNDKEHKQDLWMISKKGSDNLTCSVCFFVDKNGQLKPVKRCAYCFFPTKVKTGLKFAVHAPFLLTDSREGIKAGEEHNLEMLKRLAELSATSLEFLNEVGKKTDTWILDDNMFDVIPYEEEEEEQDSQVNFSFGAIRKAMQEKMKHADLLPGETNYYRPSVSYIPATEQIAELLPQDRVRQLLGQKKKRQILKSLTFQDLPKKLQDFLKGLGVSIIDEDCMMKHLQASFISRQDSEWLSELYSFLSETQNRVNQAKLLPIFLDADGRACSAFAEDGSETLFLGAEGASDCKLISPKLLAEEGTLKLVKEMGLKEPTLQSRVLNIILPSFANGRDPRDEAAFLEIFKCYEEMRDDRDKKKFVEQASNCSFLLCIPTKGQKKQAKKGVCPKDAYYPNEQLKEYFKPLKGAAFVDLKFYQRIVEDHTKLDEFLLDLGVSDVPRLCKRDVDIHDDNFLAKRKWAHSAPAHPEKWLESEMDGCREALDYVIKEKDKQYSQTLWNTMVAFLKKNSPDGDPQKVFFGVHHYFSYGRREENYIPSVVFRMRKMRWLVDKNGLFINAEKARSILLNNGYDLLSQEGRMLAQFVRIVDPSEREIWADKLDEIARKNCGESFESLLKDPKKMKSFEDWLRSQRPAPKPDLDFSQKTKKSGPNRQNRGNQAETSEKKHLDESDDDEFVENTIHVWPGGNKTRGIPAGISENKPSEVSQSVHESAGRTRLSIQGRDGTMAGQKNEKEHQGIVETGKKVILPRTESKTEEPRTDSIGSAVSPPSSKPAVGKPSSTKTPTPVFVVPTIQKHSPTIPAEPSLRITVVFPRPTTLLTNLRKELIDLFNMSPFPKATYIISVLVPKQKGILDEMVIVERVIEATQNIPHPLLRDPKNSSELVEMIRESMQQIKENGANLGLHVDLTAIKDTCNEALTFYSQ